MQITLADKDNYNFCSYRLGQGCLGHAREARQLDKLGEAMLLHMAIVGVVGVTGVPVVLSLILAGPQIIIGEAFKVVVMVVLADPMIQRTEI